MNLRLIISFCFFLLIVGPLTASAACPPGGTAVEIISKVNTHTYEWVWSEGKTPAELKAYKNICANFMGKVQDYVGNIQEIVTDMASSEINELPQCQPVGQLARECVDHEAVSTFLIAGGCAVNYEYTVCAYSPFKQGILGDDIGVQKKPAKRQRGPRSRRGR